MRLHSTPESVKNREVSFLAIVETLLAIGALLWLSLHFNTLKWLGWAVCFPPLLLLRTDESVKLGVKWFDMGKGPFRSISKFGGNQFEKIGTGWKSALLAGPFLLASVVFFGALTFVWALCIRIAAPTVIQIRRFPAGLKALPDNWARTALSLDIWHDPEIIPGHDELGSFEILREIVRDNSSSKADSILSKLIVLTLGLCFLPAYLYRWSLKATSIVFAPLIWLAWTASRPLGELRKALAMFVKSDLTKLGIGYALFFILVFAVKVLCYMAYGGFAEFWNQNGAVRLLRLYVAPSEIPVWQIASVSNACISIGFFLFCRYALLGIEHGSPLSEPLVERVWRWVTVVRWLLTFYTISCTIYITINAARGLPWPSLGEKLFPWM